MNSKILFIRSSIILNVFLVFYICVSWFNKVPDVPSYQPASAFQQSRNLESLSEKSSENSVSSYPLTSRRISDNALGFEEPIIKDADVKINGLEVQDADVKINGLEVQDQEKNMDEDSSSFIQEPPRFVQESMGVTDNLVASEIATDAPDPPLDSLEKKMYPDLRDCQTRPQVSFASQRGSYWVLENYIPAAMSFRCDESITYTTHGDFTFLDNLEILTSRWQGPVSIAVYAPGTDFQATIDTVLYLRNCWAEGIKKYVTFHFIYHTDHVPATIPSTDELLQRKIDCSGDAPQWQNITTYKKTKKLLYPINIARNVARRMASTYFVFPSDVELYPSTNFIPEFFKMLKKPDVTNSTSPRVFVLSIFEVKETAPVPETKTDLIKMIKTKDAIPFHQKVCKMCHSIPHSKEWLAEDITPGMSVVHTARRHGTYKKWEPIYVGTNKEPLYDERLSWEGKSDKMTQMYILCVRDYEFHILDNAFLVHRPGIKSNVKDPGRQTLANKQSTLIHKHILPEYKRLFGTKKECVV